MEEVQGRAQTIGKVLRTVYVDVDSPIVCRRIPESQETLDRFKNEMKHVTSYFA